MTCPCPEKDSPGLQPAYDCHPQRLQNPEDTCVPRITAMTASSKSPWAEGRHGPTDLCIPPSLLLSLHVDSVHLAGPAATWARGRPAIASTSSRRKLFRAPKWFRSLLCVEQWLSPRGSCPPGDRWQCLELSLIVTLGDRGGAMGIRWAEPRDATKHPTLHRTTPTARNSPAPNVRSAEAKETLMWGLRKAGLAPRS